MQTQEATRYREARFHRLPDDAGSRFDQTPFPYEHNLSNLDLFEFEALCDLARKFEHDYFVAGGAQTPGAAFYSVKYGEATPYEALRRLDTERRRVLLKRPEQYDPRYRELMHGLFEQAIALRGGLARGERLTRLDSSILISSAATITPFHFDPEVSFFFQIAGDKIYHVFSPSALTEPELERFYWMGIVNIGQVELAGRDPRKEHVFNLRAGLGMHQPQNSLHLQLIHLNPDQFPALQFPRHRQVRHQRHTVPHGHKKLDRLNRRQLDRHIQWRPVALEGLDYLLPQRRGHIVRHKQLLTQVGD